MLRLLQKNKRNEINPLRLCIVDLRDIISSKNP
jgi:hypothetical protein